MQYQEFSRIFLNTSQQRNLNRDQLLRHQQQDKKKKQQKLN